MIKKISYCNTNMAQQLADLEKEIFGTAWNKELIKQKINNDEFLYWVYEINSEIVGYLAIQKNFKELHILGIGVKEIFRNQSIAKKLTIELIDYFEESKYEQILLEVRVSNSVAINMYESFAFKNYGVREKYY